MPNEKAGFSLDVPNDNDALEEIVCETAGLSVEPNEKAGFVFCASELTGLLDSVEAGFEPKENDGVLVAVSELAALFEPNEKAGFVSGFEEPKDKAGWLLAVAVQVGVAAGAPSENDGWAVFASGNAGFSAPKEKAGIPVSGLQALCGAEALSASVARVDGAGSAPLCPFVTGASSA